MKTDTELKQDVMAELAWDPAVNATAVGVAVKDGVVSVSGQLETFAEKLAVERALRRVDGVQALALALDVRLSPQHQRSDAEIAAAAELALRWHTSLPSHQLRLTVEHGWIQLQGEVDWDYQRRAAEKVVRHLTGVVGISNEIQLKRHPTPQDLSLRIEAALKRQALREARRVQVAVSGDTVTLSGQVHSWQEREAAQGSAWSAPGVHTVINNLRVGP